MRFGTVAGSCECTNCRTPGSALLLGMGGKRGSPSKRWLIWSAEQASQVDESQWQGPLAPCRAKSDAKRTRECYESAGFALAVHCLGLPTRSMPGWNNEGLCYALTHPRPAPPRFTKVPPAPVLSRALKGEAHLIKLAAASAKASQHSHILKESIEVALDESVLGQAAPPPEADRRHGPESKGLQNVTKMMGPRGAGGKGYEPSDVLKAIEKKVGPTFVAEAVAEKRFGSFGGASGDTYQSCRIS